MIPMTRKARREMASEGGQDGDAYNKAGIPVLLVGQSRSPYSIVSGVKRSV